MEKVKSNGSQGAHMHSAHPPRSSFDPRKPSVTSIMPDGDVPNFTGLTADEAALVALGYKQEFKREFSLWTTFCVSFAVLGLLPSFASTLYYGMGYAGTGGMVWGWLISWFFIQCVAMGMAELCSSMPTRYVFAKNLRGKMLMIRIVAGFIMLLLFWRLQDMVHLLHGLLGGRIGAPRLRERLRWTMLCLL
jgi:hypothetical protein